ncbi:transposase (plasmid) [Xenorhabdus nematophila ATCC 19061]|uniref:Transposase n=1 Tax=Xenorhabdus nematophila (strain ATCC 19061 / DSM 3370 / CCUG 14189 / LMG 1036 / NCIMB 9965 / AN6) TaxID=406817 RepID=D3VM30_XENNA|nr:Tn3 family transposase [Xenorhabdus nematophila]CBJ92982.1 transposase [Xenorhabdus nematophila ATCC 19061]CEK25600.1 transposase [Xenorhabdus nematophila AN6/1]
MTTDCTKKNEKRLHILNPSEVRELYERPVFNQADREEYFSLDPYTTNIVAELNKPETRIYFILLIGYFRAKPVIPKFNLNEVAEDAEYIRKTYFPDENPEWMTMSKSTRSKLVNKALDILNFQRFTEAHYTVLITRLKDVVTICTEPRYIFDETLAFFGQKRIALPGYTRLQELVTEALIAEQQRIEAILSQQMSEATADKLKQLLSTKGLLNRLSAYKGTARDFSPSELDRELETHLTIKDIYPELKSLMGSLGLSQGNTLHYASIIKHTSVYQVRHYPHWQGLLYLTCYLYFRYRETNDKLVIAFCYLTRKYHEAAKAFAKQKIADELELVREKLKYAGDILHYFVDENVSDVVEFGEIRQQAFSLISKEEIHAISQHLGKNDFDLAGYEWEYLDKQSRKIANSLRKLFIAIDIECESDQKVLSDQIMLSKHELAGKRKIITTHQEMLKKSDRRYLWINGEVHTKRFEFYLYQKISRQLDRGKAYVTESEKNKRLEDDLIPVKDWENDQINLIEKTGLQRLSSPITQTLNEFEKRLELHMNQVAASISGDTNEFVKLQPRSNQLAWTLANQRWRDDIDNPIYSQIRHMGIIEIMNHVNRKTGFLGAFKGIATRKRCTKAEADDLIACIFGNGTNYGLHRIAAISDRSIGVLRGVNDAFVRPETISAANDLISNGIARLPVFRYYTLNESSPFGSIDGQKYACRINTFKARFSAKYFRKGKGVSAMTLVSNHVPIKTTVISPNEYEGHYAFDLLYNNSSDIQPKSLATDTHGINNVNFAILDLFGYQFSPRYARFKQAFAEQFEVNTGTDMTISLKKPIKRKLIEQEWGNIQHIICSLSRKVTQQSTVVKKLSNNKRNNRTLLALHEYDRLIKCLYLLEYVDNKTLGQFVQQALNRGEAYHQLRRAIASVNGNQFRGGNDYQIEQWNDCARLIANCIIYYNSALLSALIEKFQEEGVVSGKPPKFCGLDYDNVSPSIMASRSSSFPSLIKV